MSAVSVPDIVGLSLTAAQSALSAVGLTLGTETPALNPNVAVGNVAFQNPEAYALTTGASVDVGISAIAVSPGINLTVISQYAQSPVLMQLTQDFSQWFDQSANWDNFYQYVWNIDSAQGFGLDFWGKVLGVGRTLVVPTAADFLGLTGSDGTASGYAFGVGVFFDGATDTQTYALSDADYRTLLFGKAFSNICRACIPVLNQLLMTVFAGYGDAYVEDNGNMAMTIYLGWTPTAVQLAILEQSGVVPHPTGVAVSVSHL